MNTNRALIAAIVLIPVMVVLTYLAIEGDAGALAFMCSIASVVITYIFKGQK